MNIILSKLLFWKVKRFTKKITPNSLGDVFFFAIISGLVISIVFLAYYDCAQQEAAKNTTQESINEPTINQFNHTIATAENNIMNGLTLITVLILISAVGFVLSILRGLGGC